MSSTQDQPKAAFRAPQWLAPVLIVVLVLLVVAIFLITSTGIDYFHAFGRACLVIHSGFHFEMHCGSVSPPTTP